LPYRLPWTAKGKRKAGKTIFLYAMPYINKLFAVFSLPLPFDNLVKPTVRMHKILCARFRVVKVSIRQEGNGIFVVYRLFREKIDRLHGFPLMQLA